MKTVIGIDVGWGFTKAIAQVVASIIFSSIVGPAEEMDFDAGLANDKKGLTIKYDGKTYFVGERAALQSRWQSRTLSRERVTTQEAKILFLSALVKLFPSGLVNNGGLSVMTGLPIAWLDDKEALAENWTGLHKVQVPGLKKSLQYHVAQVEVVPQAWGSLVREMISPDGKSVKDRALFDGDVVVLDWGTLTVGFLSFSQREYIQHESASLDNGMGRVLQVLQREILRVYGRDMALHQVDEVLRKGAVRIDGDMKPVHDLIKPVIDDITDNAVAQAKSLWADGSKSHVLLTGGGAIVLGKVFKEKYGHPHTSIVHNAQMANAEGLLLWALMKERFSA